MKKLRRIIIIIISCFSMLVLNFQVDQGYSESTVDPDANYNYSDVPFYNKNGSIFTPTSGGHTVANRYQESWIPSGLDSFGFMTNASKNYPSYPQYSSYLGGSAKYTLDKDPHSFISSDIKISKPTIGSADDQGNYDLSFEYGVTNIFGGAGRYLLFNTAIPNSWSSKVKELEINPSKDINNKDVNPVNPILSNGTTFKKLFPNQSNGKYSGQFSDNINNIYSSAVYIDNYHGGAANIKIKLAPKFIDKSSYIIAFMKSDATQGTLGNPNNTPDRWRASFQAQRVLNYRSFGDDFNKTLLEKLKSDAISKLDKKSQKYRKKLMESVMVILMVTKTLTIKFIIS